MNAGNKHIASRCTKITGIRIALQRARSSTPQSKPQHHELQIFLIFSTHCVWSRVQRLFLIIMPIISNHYRTWELFPSVTRAWMTNLGETSPATSSHHSDDSNLLWNSSDVTTGNKDKSVFFLPKQIIFCFQFDSISSNIRCSHWRPNNE